MAKTGFALFTSSLMVVTLCAPDGRAQCTTRLVNVSSTGEPGNAAAGGGSISNDGRFVAFNSGATNLVPGDSNGFHDVFVRDLWTGETILASRSSSGELGDGTSTDGVISGDGRWVAFQSAARNFESTPETSYMGVFLRDLVLGTTVRVSENAAGELANGAAVAVAVSDGGRFVCFGSEASNLVPGDTNGVPDVFVYDVAAAAPTRVSVSSSGEQATDQCQVSDMSEDGRWIVFDSRSSNLDEGISNGFANIFVHDSLDHTTERIGQRMELGLWLEGNGNSFEPQISRDGSIVAFKTQATNLVEPDTNDAEDVLVWRRQSAQLSRASQNAQGEQANAKCGAPTISSDGLFVAFPSGATNLVAGDIEGQTDTFVVDMRTGVPRRATENDQGEGADAHASAGVSLAGGAYVTTFLTNASNLGAGDEKAGWQDLYARTCPVPPVPYCISEINSSGNAALIGFEGSPSILANDLTLTVSGVPRRQFALLLAGSTQRLQFFGDGFLCVGGGATGVHRLLPPVLTDDAGYFERRVDLVGEGTWIAPGAVWNFQFWFRDPHGPGGTGFNLSDALNVIFHP